ncbi:hypothetical protein [Pseudomonas sp. SST3]|uniref:hypothetical protein n=1 Tax=Pseudomonas sp. SST3 TaxID=2267882 RepID=UPI001F5103C2|nr:hypothetical protein [Pseudomonas sp. SST3]
MNRILLLGAGLVFVSGIAVADADGDLTNPSTTGTEAMEQPAPPIEDAGLDERDDMNDRPGEAGDESGLGTMGTGATGTTGGMGATTGTDTIGDRDAETDQ